MTRLSPIVLYGVKTNPNTSTLIRDVSIGWKATEPTRFLYLKCFPMTNRVLLFSANRCLSRFFHFYLVYVSTNNYFRPLAL